MFIITTATREEIARLIAPTSPPLHPPLSDNRKWSEVDPWEHVLPEGLPGLKIGYLLDTYSSANQGEYRVFELHDHHFRADGEGLGDQLAWWLNFLGYRTLLEPSEERAISSARKFNYVNGLSERGGSVAAGR